MFGRRRRPQFGRQSSSNQTRLALIVFGLLLTAFADPCARAQLVNNEWNAGSGIWNVTGNWFPFGVPDNGADGFDYSVLIGNRAVAANAVVTFVPRDGVSDTVTTLAISQGADLLTNGRRLIVLGQATVDGLGSTLRADANENAGSLSFQATQLVVRNSAQLAMTGGNVYAATIDLLSNATLQGGGLVIFGDADALLEDAFDNSGAIIVGSGGTSNNTLTLQSNGIDWIDLDGDNERGLVDVSNNVADPLSDALTLVIDAPLEDPFGGKLQIGSRDTVDFRQRMLMTDATVELDGGDHVATLTGGPDTGIVNQTTFNITGDALINAPLFIGTSTISVAEASSLTLAGSIWIDRTFLSLQNSSELIVTGNATITHNLDINWDGVNGAATTTVRGTGALTIGVDELDTSSNDFSGTLNLVDSGKATVNVTADSWIMSGTLNKTAMGASSITGDAIEVRGAVNVSGGALALPKTILTTGANVNVAADGVLELGDASTFDAPTSMAGAGVLRMTGGSTTTLPTTIDVAMFDWDGLTTGQTHVIQNGDSLTINSPVFDDDGDMDDRIIVAAFDAKLIVNGPTEWTMAGRLSAGVGANRGLTTIGGTSRMILANRFDVDGDVLVSAPITFGDGSVIVTGTGTRLNVIGEAAYGSATIGGGSGGNGGVFDPAAVNNVFGVATISDINFDFDGGDWNVRAGGQLKIVNVRDYDLLEPTNGFDRTISVTDGDVLVDTLDPRFVMNGTMALSSNIAGQTVDWEGDPVDIGDDLNALDAHLNVTGTGRSRFKTDVAFHADAVVNVAAGATLSLENHVLFNTFGPSGSSEFQGSGTLMLQHTANFADPTTIDMRGGTVDFDGDDAIGNTIAIGAPVTINAAVFSDFGRTNTMGGLNVIAVNSDLGAGTLTINLDSPNAAWTLNPEGVLNLTNGKERETLLAGHDAVLNGTLNVSGDVQVDARITVAGSVNVTTPGEPLQLAGGDSAPVANRIVGGTISGAGLLGANADRSLQGFGVINTGVDFDGTAALRADDGTLTINGAILDVGQIGTRDADGVLNVTNPWNTNVAESVRLDGGELRGAPVTIGNAEGLIGQGLVSARVINDTRISARPGVLIIATSANDNDWDGATNIGMLTATNGGTLELRDKEAFNFGGGVAASTGARVFAKGFALDFQQGSTIQLDAGTYESTHATNVRGNLAVGPGNSAIELAAGQRLDFRATSALTVDGNLTLHSDRIAVEAGATLAGNGSLIVPSGSEFIAAANANLNVLLDNRGDFRPAGTDVVGRILLGEYQQAATGKLLVELAGIGLNQFDRLAIDGGALLDGTLNIDIDGSFVPTLGQTFNFLTASDGVSGTFDVVEVNEMPAGLTFQVDYLPTIVQLKVIAAPLLSADFDDDGDVDGNDLARWRGAFGSNSNADADGDNDSDGNDFLHWQRQLGRVPAVVAVPPTPTGAVPEPTGLAAAIVGASALLQTSRQLRRAPMVAALQRCAAINTRLAPLTCSSFLAAMLATLVALTTERPAQAVTHTWKSLGDGDYTTANNWFPATVPGADDFVTFEIGFDNPYSIRFPGKRSFEPPGNYFASHLRVRDSNVTFTGTTQQFVGQSTYTITSSVQGEVDRGVIIGLNAGDESGLTLRHVGNQGSILSNVTTRAATIGDGPDAKGTLNVVTGAFHVTGSMFGERQFIVGRHGHGVVNLTGGPGTGVHVTGSNSTTSLGRYRTGVGEVTVSNGSVWVNHDQLWVGENGVGTFTVKDGGDLITSSNAGNTNIIGVFAGSSGHVAVTGDGSTWQSANAIQVGNVGSGQLTIARGGTVINTVPAINTVGMSSFGDVLINDPGSNWVARGTLLVGSTGTGRVQVLNGGYMFTTAARIGGLNTGSGEVIVGGKGSQWDVIGGPLEIGYADAGFDVAPGTVTINAGALVFVPLDVDLDSPGTLRLNGGTLATGSIGSRDSASQRFEGAIDWIAGKLHANNINGTIVNQGGILSPGVIAGPGVVAGRTTIDGHYTQQSAATLDMEIGGVTREGEYDFVYVEGAASVAGELRLSLINNFLPEADQMFTILDSLNPISGAFSNVASGERLTTSDGMGSFKVDYGPGSPFDPNRIVLSNFINLDADFDNDGDVDNADLTQWQSDFGLNDQSDADGDGDSDGDDLLIWQRQFGRSATPPASTTVPETGHAYLPILLVTGVVFIRQQRSFRHLARDGSKTGLQSGPVFNVRQASARFA